MINSRAGISWLTLLFVACCGIGRAQDTLKNISSSTGLAQYCGSDHVFVSENQTINYEVLADARAIVKSQGGITLKPGFKAGEFSNEGFFLAKIVNACGEMVWTGAESSDWNEPGNWESYGVPGANDEVVIQVSPNEPVYDGGGNEVIKALAIQGSDLVVNSDLQIAESLELSSGVINSENGMIKLLDNSTVTGGDSDSYVQGYVSKSGASSFVFPLGDKGFYRPLTLEEPLASGVYRARYHEENSNDIYSHDFKEAGISEISTTGYWEFYKEIGPDVSLSVGYDQLHSCGITNTADVEVTVWDGVQWTSQGVLNFSGNDLSAAMSSDELSAYGPLTLSVSEPAPEIVLNLVEDRSVLYSEIVPLGNSPVADGGQPPYDYRWTVADANWSTAEVPELPIYNSGLYELEARDNKGCLGLGAVDVEVKPSLVIDLSHLGNLLEEDQLSLHVVTEQFDEYVEGGVASFNYDLNTSETEVELTVGSVMEEGTTKFSFDINQSGEIENVAFHEVDEFGNETDVIPLSDNFYNGIDGGVEFYFDGSAAERKKPSQDMFISELVDLEGGILMTPNQDGQFDEFGVKMENPPSYYSLVIEDRRGNELYQTNDSQDKWDGTYQGQFVRPGAYHYSIVLDSELIQGQFLVDY